MARSFNDCLSELKAGGALSDEEFARLRDDFENRRNQHRMNFSEDEAASRAGAELEADLRREAIEKQRRLALTKAAQDRLKETLASFRGPDGAPDVNEAAMREIQRIEHRAHAVEAQARGMIADLLFETRKTPLSGTIRDKALIDDVVRAWHGDAVASPEARAFAHSLNTTFEWLRQRSNDAGSAIGKLENYGMPHFHDPRALRKAGFETWREAILPRLDPARTGLAIAGREWSEAEVAAALPRIYGAITTEGWADRTPGMVASGRSFAARNAEPRMLHFRSGDEWLAYNADFGAGAPFQAIMHGVTRRARDIAAMEILGPNPDGMVTWLGQVVQQQGALAAAGRASLARRSGEAADWAATYAGMRIQHMWDNLRGASTDPASAWAQAFGTLRSVNVAAKLGGAVLTAFGDLGTSRLARSFNDIGGSVLGDLVRYLATYRASQDEAIRAGLMIDSALRVFDEGARYAKGWAVREIADYAADRVLALSGLTPWTNAARHSFGFGFFAEVADHAGREFTELPPHLRAAFERHGLTAADWRIIRAADIHVPPGGGKSGFIRPADIMALTEAEALPRVQTLLQLTEADAAKAADMVRHSVTETATRYHEMVLDETEYAVPTTTVRARTLIAADTRPGSVAGEVLRSVTQFKAWPLTFGLLWGQRIASELVADRAGGSWHQALYGRGAAYATGLFATMTLFGALGVQLKNIRAGRDPESMDASTAEGRKFWIAALQQGGGLGIYGDFLFADYNRFGGGLGATVGGPNLGTLEQLGKVAMGPLRAASDEKQSRFGRELVRLAQQTAPGGNVWYLDLAAKRLLFDNLQRLADPDAEKAFAGQIRARQNERRQRFFWAPGEAAPERPPDFGAMAGR